jgi:hypothetical protein
LRASARLLALTGLVLAASAAAVRAEPAFLSRQYTRCTTCHFSATGGGLLTPYGRSLSRQELSTFGRSPTGSQPGNREHEFLWGALGNRLGALSVGIDVRPAHLDVNFVGGDLKRDFFMTADLLAAYRRNGWTLYGEFGREPRSTGTRLASYEYWVAHQSEKGLGFKAGRFLPAYGINFADHTAFTRASLGLDSYDQVLGLELSHTSERHLAQLSVSPGRADSISNDDGRRAFTSAGRFQWDFGPRTALVASGLYRGSSRFAGRGGSAGLALGLAPAARLSIWTEADALFEHGRGGAPAYAIVNETGFEVYRGVWLKFSPQLRTEFGDTSAGSLRMAFELNLLPRTHWNVDTSFYRDRNRQSDAVTKTFLIQLHMYL